MGKVVLITGAAKGIGRALALGMADRGYDLVINDLPADEAALNEVAGRIRDKGQRALPVLADVSVKKQVQEMVQKALDEFGQLDVLVNNAGVLTVSLVEDLPEETWDRIFDVNAKGTFLVTQAVIPHMKARRSGRIIHISSIGGKQGAPGQAHYCASKAATIEFTRVLAMELGPYGITVNAVCHSDRNGQKKPRNARKHRQVDECYGAEASRRA
jgi:3-oxoacyl-[acyl-carrier protein] reductase